jgi:hypothetical protein
VGKQLGQQLQVLLVFEAKVLCEFVIRNTISYVADIQVHASIEEINSEDGISDDDGESKTQPSEGEDGNKIPRQITND